MPEDLSLIGFDDIQTAEFVIPPLTTVRQNRLQIGAQTAGLLLRQLAGANCAPDKIVTLPVSFQIRNSTSAPRPAHRPTGSNRRLGGGQDRSLARAKTDPHRPLARSSGSRPFRVNSRSEPQPSWVGPEIVPDPKRSPVSMAQPEIA